MTSVHLPVLHESTELFTRGGRAIHPVSLSINETMIPVSTATMVCTRDEIYNRRQVFELYTVNGLSGYYRIRSYDINYKNDLVTYQLEHIVAEVGDWLVRQDITTNSTVRGIVRTAWRGSDTSSTSDDGYRGSLWGLGDVSLLASPTIAAGVKNRDNLLSTILDVIRNCQNVYMKFDYDTDPWTIDFVRFEDDDSRKNASCGFLSRNVESAQINYDFTDLCTRVIFYYDGSWRSYTADQEYLNKYGTVETKIETESETSLTRAQFVARQYLSQHQQPDVSVSIDGYDLFSITGVEQDKFEIGKLIRLYVPEINDIIGLVISGLRWVDVFGDPLRVQVSLGTNPTLWAYRGPITKK